MAIICINRSVDSVDMYHIYILLCLKVFKYCSIQYRCVQRNTAMCVSI